MLSEFETQVRGGGLGAWPGICFIFSCKFMQYVVTRAGGWWGLRVVRPCQTSSPNDGPVGLHWE